MDNTKPIIELTEDSDKPTQKVTPLGDKNFTFQINHQRVLEMVEACIDEGYLPSPTLLAERLVLSRKTIYDHLPYITYYHMDRDEHELIQLRKKRLMERLYQIALDRWDLPCSGSLKALEMYLKYAGTGVIGANPQQAVNIQING